MQQLVQHMTTLLEHANVPTVVMGDFNDVIVDASLICPKETLSTHIYLHNQYNDVVLQVRDVYYSD